MYKQERMYYRSGTGGTLRFQLADGSTLLREMTSWSQFWNCDIKLKIKLCQSMCVYVKKIPGKFHPDPIWNDGAFDFFGSSWRAVVNVYTRPINNNMSSDEISSWSNKKFSCCYDSRSCWRTIKSVSAIARNPIYPGSVYERTQSPKLNAVKLECANSTYKPLMPRVCVFKKLTFAFSSACFFGAFCG